MTTVNPAAVPLRTLSSGEQIPAIGMGTFGSDHAEADVVSAAVKSALDIGYRLIDCASCYGNEAQIGEVFSEAFSGGKVKREELFVASKVWNDMHGEGDVLLSCAQTLKDLKLQYLDIYYVHWPFPNYHPPKCDVNTRNPDSKPFSVDHFMKTWRQMERLVDMGLTRYIGMSNMTIPKLEAVLPLCRIKPAAIELECHPCFQQKELKSYLEGHGILPVAFCPLGSPDRPARDCTPEDVADLKEPVLLELAEAHHVHPVNIALKWEVQSGVVPIPFSTKPQNLLSNLQGVTEGPLTDEEMKRMESLECGNRLVKGQVFLWEGAKDWHDLWDENGIIVK